MATAVVNTAMLQCTCGAAPAALIVNSQMKVKIGNQLAGTIMDNKPVANIPTFGACSVLSAPCAPATAAPWSPGSTSIVKIGNYPALLDTDKLVCTVGGTISVTSPGQQPTKDT